MDRNRSLYHKLLTVNITEFTPKDGDRSLVDLSDVTASASFGTCDLFVFFVVKTVADNDFLLAIG